MYYRGVQKKSLYSRLILHDRILKRKVLQSWQAFVPVSVAERLQEVRRTELRRKVAAWLPDYQPRTAPQCSDD